ncbi:MAG: DNA mismatch repair protein MutS [Fusobacteriaceae bacterium]|nr:DNA mismatch repair protein MutS [Fusobacteriaceae bacterium]MBN2837944.1 DNA mismatch repair protein MutS [Fusobacteriaceae bacterium]
MAKETPLMQQYREIKEQNKDSILFFRLGDFYEMFFDDAVIASKELGITLTSRNKEKDQDVPLAGIPYHSSASYISKLVQKGYKVAICEQVEDPKLAKGIVKREVVRVITPGTVLDLDYLDSKSNNYLLGFVVNKYALGVSYLDITTGEFKTTEIIKENNIGILLNEINKVAPTEIVTDESSYELCKKELDNYLKQTGISLNILKKVKKSNEFLKEYFGVVSLESFGLMGKDYCIETSAMVLEYVLDLQKYNEIPVNKISYINKDLYVELNLSTQKNLELIENPKEKSSHGTLLWVLDECKTSMGSRKLKEFIKNPLLNKEEILLRQKHVEYFLGEIIIREEIKDKLKDVYDIERLIGKIILGTENGRDLISLKKSLKSAKKIGEILGENIVKIDLSLMDKLYKKIDDTIIEEAPFSIREGGMIKSGVNEELDDLHNISNTGKDFIIDIETKEKEKTGIKTLKVKYNKVFGYFIEITNNNLHLVPADYIRKQTLSNAERYITEELKIYESKILNAKDKIEGLEYEIFKALSDEIREYKKELQNLASNLAYLDVIISFATVAIKNSYVKPTFNENNYIHIKEGRHPIVEKLIGEENFVKNDIVLDDKERIIILTGPNMAGKSTYMKGIALIILMAQIGSFVPATEANIEVVDKIFTRVGASDDLISGQSTFMVEMSEVANIINNATEKSFIILDEVGRGTSTFDGISIATSITEYINKNIKAKTIFATHYHELTDLEEKLEYVVNYRIEVKETDKEVIFLREIVRGGADKSYGIEVAKLAGLPREILVNSEKILNKLQEKERNKEKAIKGLQLNLFDGVKEEVEEEKEIVNPEEKKALDDIRMLDTNSLTPIEALLFLDKIKKSL